MKNADHLHPRKSLGQNFLRDGNVARRITHAFHPSPEDVVVEIGPGEGALSTHLADVVRRFVVVDIDARVVERMHRVFAGRGVEIRHEDFLKTDLADLMHRHGRKLRIIGNIPYNITSPILFHVLDHREYVQDFLLMIQREVARRIVAPPRTKEYGILSVFCQLYTDARLLFDVSPNSFFPRPKVTSSVIHLEMLATHRYPLKDEAMFRAMVRSVFGKRRKTLRNSLRYFADLTGIPIPPSFDLRQRPEDLTVKQLVDLGNAIGETMSVAPSR